MCAMKMWMRTGIESIGVIGMGFCFFVEAAVLRFGEGDSGVVMMCGEISEVRDVTLVLLQAWANSY